VGTITVEGPTNKSVKVKLKDPTVLQQVKPGEQVELLITEAFAIAWRLSAGSGRRGGRRVLRARRPPVLAVED
jgi:hypothetical protein